MLAPAGLQSGATRAAHRRRDGSRAILTKPAVEGITSTPCGLALVQVLPRLLPGTSLRPTGCAPPGGSTRSPGHRGEEGAR